MLRKVAYLIAFSCCLFGLYQYIGPMIFESDIKIPEQITFQHESYESTDSFIQTEALRPKPEFLPTGHSVQGDQFGALDGGRVYQNPKTDAIYIQNTQSNPTKFVLYVKK